MRKNPPNTPHSRQNRQGCTLGWLGTIRQRLVGLGGVLTLLAITSTAGVVRAAEPPAQVIAAYQASLLAAMKAGKAAGFKARQQILAPAVRAAYNLPVIARRSVGRGWRTMSAADKAAYRKAFADFSIATHASSFSGFGGEKFAQDGVDDLPRGYKLVKTRLIRASGAPVALNYLMKPRDGQWKVVDVFVRGTISEVATRRSEFSALLRDKGAGALIALLKARTAKLAAGD